MTRSFATASLPWMSATALESSMYRMARHPGMPPNRALQRTGCPAPSLRGLVFNAHPLRRGAVAGQSLSFCR